MTYKKTMLFSAINGLLFSLPFLFDFFIFPLFFAFAFLFYCQEKIKKKLMKIVYLIVCASVWQFVVLSWFHHYYTALFWETNLLILFLTVSALLFLLPYFLFIPARINFNIRYLVFVAIWLVYEIILVEWEIRYPMLSLGVVLGNFPPVIQWYSLTGITGGSLWILLVNLLVVKILRKEFYTYEFALSGVLVVVPVIVSLITYYAKEPERNKINIVAVNLKYEDKQDSEFIKSLNLLKNTIDGTTDLALCPEGLLYLPSTSFPVNRYFSEIKKILKSQSPKASVVFGCNSNTPERFDMKDTCIYNLAVCCDTSGFVSFRNKTCLVPFGEFIPYKKYIGQIDVVKQTVNRPVIADGAFDNTFKIRNKDVEILPLICYELYFGNKIRKYFSHRRISLISCVCNEYAVPCKTYYVQFVRMARIQAITFKTPIMKSTINGYSSIIDRKGGIVSTDYNIDGTVKGEIGIKPEHTFYSKYNHLIVCTLLLILFGSSFIIGKKKKL